MRRGFAFWVGAVLAVLGAVGANRAGAQDPEPRYWPLREINFPVPVEKIQAMTPKPVKLRFHVAPDRGKFKLVAEKAINDLDVIDVEKAKRGFRYTSPVDGEYDFALQFVYADGDAQPRDGEITTQYRIVFDTRPPLVRIAPLGPSGVEWSVEDENLKPDAVSLEVRWQGTQAWKAVTPRAFNARDRYTWNGLPNDKVLEVRVIGRDKAGLEMASRVVTLPTTGNASGLGDVGTSPRTPGVGTGFGNPDEFPARPEVQHVGHRNLTVESKLTRVTRSGVKAAELWVNDGKTGWKLDKTQTVQILPTDADPLVKIPFVAAKDGLYGFVVIPINGAGGKQDAPKRDDPAQLLVYVDTEKPVIQIRGTKVSPGGAIGPRVEIDWQVTESNPLPDPITLEYAEEKTGPWKPIATNIRDTGRYVWEVEDKNIWRFYLRATARDKAGNRGEHVYEKEIVIDLDKPAAVIEKVQGTGGGGTSPPPNPIERLGTLPDKTPTPTTPTSPIVPSAIPDLGPAGK